MSYYTYDDLGYGMTIEAPDGREVAFLQGDDYANLMEEIETAEGHEFPYGPFKDAESLVSAILDQYDMRGLDL